MFVASDPSQPPSLPASDDRFRAVFEYAPIGMAIVGLGTAHLGRCLTANSIFASMMAMPVDELTGVPLADFVHRDDRAAWIDALEQLERSGVDAVRVELRLHVRGGKDLTALFSASLAHADGDRWSCAIIQVLPAAVAV